MSALPSSNRDSRGPAFYRAILALPIAVAVGLLLTGRWQAYWRVVRTAGRGPRADFDDAFVTGVFFSLSLLPLMLTAWKLGRRHTAARRLNYEMSAGMRDVWRRALGRPSPSDTEVALERPPRDRPRVALLFGLGTAVFLPVFFMSVLADLRSPAGAVWLGGAGVLMGAAVYCQRRSSAYLVQEPRYFDPFRQFRLLNPSRYEPAGRPFVRAQIVATVLLPIWWLGGGVTVLP